MRDRVTLTAPLPRTITVRGEKIPILTDFRRWILLTELMESHEADAVTRAELALRTVCPDHPIPTDGEEFADLLAAVTAFANPFGEKRTPSASAGEAPLVFDFEEDAARIAASFRLAYGIDLFTARLHWWEFLTLLRSLPESTPFMQVIRLRTCDTTEIEDDALRRRIRRAKAAARLSPRR